MAKVLAGGAAVDVIRGGKELLPGRQVGRQCPLLILLTFGPMGGRASGEGGRRAPAWTAYC